MNQFDAFARFARSCCGFAAFFDSVDDLFEVALVLVEVDRSWIVRAEAGVGALHKLCTDSFILVGLVHEVPGFECFVGEEHGAFGASELHAGRVAVFGPRAGAAFDDTTRAIFEFDDGDGDVFDFDVGVGEAGGVGLHRLHWASEVEQCINCVDRLIHQCTTAVECPSATPCSGVVVGLIAIPFYIGGGGGEFTKTSCIGGLLESIHPRVEAPVEHGGDGDAFGLGGCDHLVDALGGDFEWLLDNDVLTCFDRSHGWVEVRTRGCADGDDVDLRIGKHGCDVVVGLCAVLLGKCLRAFQHAIRRADKFAACHGCNCFGVKAADHSCSYNSEVHIKYCT